MQVGVNAGRSLLVQLIATRGGESAWKKQKAKKTLSASLRHAPGVGEVRSKGCSSLKLLHQFSPVLSQQTQTPRAWNVLLYQGKKKMLIYIPKEVRSWALVFRLRTWHPTAPSSAARKDKAMILLKLGLNFPQITLTDPLGCRTRS